MILTIIDTETTGLIRRGQPFPKVLETGFIQIDQRLEILRGGSFYFYQSDWVVQESALQVNHLTQDFLQQYEQCYYSSLVKLWTLLQGGYIIGKNSDAFDIPVCRAMFADCPDMLEVPCIAKSIDVQKLYAPVFRSSYEERYGQKVNRAGQLGEYMDVLGLTQEQVASRFKALFPDETRCNAHGALYDAYMTYLVFEDIVKRGIFKFRQGV